MVLNFHAIEIVTLFHNIQGVKFSKIRLTYCVFASCDDHAH